MKNFSNKYIVLFSTVMVVIVALFLAFAATSLKPFQERNIEIEKKQNILASLNIRVPRAQAEELYARYITGSFVVNTKGEMIPGIDAFAVDMKKELAKPISERMLPVYIATLDDSTKASVVPLRGKGLWGPIWGYIAFKEDMNTIVGSMFDHQGETPGLGAEISQPFFQNQFIGKKIFDPNGKFTSIKVMKGGATPGSSYEVDAISGGTITSKGLEAMVDTCLSAYKVYFNMNSKPKNEERWDSLQIKN
jgi:Na+-transporting NADH:ubiquinone oxidoreductase subunit C